MLRQLEFSTVLDCDVQGYQYCSLYCFSKSLYCDV